jgi:uncharacterized protein YuzE
MAEVSVLYDREGQTLTVRFSDRHQEHICEETGDEVVLMKDSAGRVIGFEKLNFSNLILADERLVEYRRDPTRAQSAHAVVSRLAKKER